MESTEELRKNRTKAKSKVTRNVNELRRLVAEDNYSEVVLKFDSVKGVFHEFEQAHGNYHDTIEVESEIITSDKYFDAVELSYIEGLQGVREYIQRGSKVSEQPVLETQDSSKSVSIVKLPPVPQPDVFSGKSELYPMWKASFNSLVV